MEFLPQKLDQFIINKKKRFLDARGPVNHEKKDFWAQEQDQLIMKKGFLGTRAGPINKKKKDFWAQEQDQLIMKKRISGYKSRTS